MEEKLTLLELAAKTKTDLARLRYIQDPIYIGDLGRALTVAGNLLIDSSEEVHSFLVCAGLEGKSREERIKETLSK